MTQEQIEAALLEILQVLKEINAKLDKQNNPQGYETKSSGIGTVRVNGR